MSLMTHNLNDIHDTPVKTSVTPNNVITCLHFLGRPAVALASRVGLHVLGYCRSAIGRSNWAARRFFGGGGGCLVGCLGDGGCLVRVLGELVALGVLAIGCFGGGGSIAGDVICTWYLIGKSG